MSVSTISPTTESLSAAVESYCGPLKPYSVVLSSKRPVPWRAAWATGPEQPDLQTATAPVCAGEFVGVLTLTCAAHEASAAVLARGLAVLLERELAWQQQQASLQTSHDQLSALLQATPLALYSLTLEGLVKHWNTAAEQTLGCQGPTWWVRNWRTPS